jgi:hypothetical protein
MKERGQMQWYRPVTPAFRRVKQENGEFETSLGYTVRPCLEKQNPTKQ